MLNGSKVCFNEHAERTLLLPACSRILITNLATRPFFLDPDLNGQIIVKPVRFRVEFSPQFDNGLPSPAMDGSSPRPATVTHFTLTQEKGALSAFKVVCARLRQEWRSVSAAAGVFLTISLTRLLIRLDSHPRFHISLSEIHSPIMQGGSRFSQAQNSPALPPFREMQVAW